MKTTIVIVMAGMLLGGVAGGETAAPDWPVFRGDPALTGVAPGRLSTNLVLQWSFKAGDSVRSSPVVGHGRVFFGAQDQKVYAVDAKDGREAWSFAAGDLVDAPPLLYEGRAYVGAMNGIFYALEAADGREVWRFETGAQIVGSANHVVSGSNDLVVVGSHDFSLYALEADSGRRVWTHESESFINGAPAVYDRLIVVGGCDAKVHFLSAQDGTGDAVEAGSFIAGSAAVRDGRVYVGHYGNQLVCIDMAQERIVWAFGSEENGAPFFSSPAVNEQWVVAGCRDKQVYGLDKATGGERWRFATGGKVDSSPVICDGKVVVGSDDGVLYMLDLRTGARMWSFDVGRSIATSPAVVQGRVFVGADDGRVYAFGERGHDEGGTGRAP